MCRFGHRSRVVSSLGLVVSATRGVGSKVPSQSATFTSGNGMAGIGMFWVFETKGVVAGVRADDRPGRGAATSSALQPGRRHGGGWFAVRALLTAGLALGLLQGARAAESAPAERYTGEPGRERVREAQRALRSLAPLRELAARLADADADGRTSAAARRAVRPVRTFRLPPPGPDEEREATTRQAAREADGNRPHAYRIGFGRDFAALAATVPDQDDLVWTPAADGGTIATFEVESPGAAAVRVELAFAGLAAGTELRVYNPAAPAETAERVALARIEAALADDGAANLWLPTVEGPSAGIEVYVPAGSVAAAVHVQVAGVSHLTSSPREVHVGSTICRNHVDAVCRASQATADARNSVAKYLFTSGGDTTFCSGTLLNDLDPATQIPWFLTADHCLDARSRNRASSRRAHSEAASMEFYWFFEAKACGERAHELVRTTGGAVVVAADPWDDGTDGMLLRLNASPPPGAGLAGWTTARVSAGDAVVTLHHPAGALKKLAMGVLDGFSYWARYGRSPREPATIEPEARSTHLKVLQADAIEGGSSGSSLWKRIDGADYVVGLLTGGPRSCVTSKWYGRFDRFYPQISSWLGDTADPVATDGTPIRRLAVVDAVTGAEVADLGVAGASIDLGYAGTASFDIVARAGAAGPGSVRLELGGALSAARTSGFAPYRLFGEGAGIGLPAGQYTVAATAYAGPNGTGRGWPAVRGAFTVSGDAPGPERAVAAIVVADPAGRFVGAARTGATLAIPHEVAGFRVVAQTAGDGQVGSVVFSVAGDASATHTDSAAPFELPRTLAFGTYAITATPHAGTGGTGAVGEPLSVERFTVSQAPTPVEGFTLVDARGGAPDPDVGAVADGAVLDVSAYGGEVSIRADGADGAHVGSVALALTGPRKLTRTEDAGGPYTLFGEGAGDYHVGWLPNGAYTLTATPYTERGGRGAALPVRTVSFTVAGTDEAPAVTGFTLVDARGRKPDPDIGPVADAAVVDVWAYGGGVSIRADGADGAHVGSVVLALEGSRKITRPENAGGPYALFGDWYGDYHEGWLPNGAYTLTATPYTARGGHGAALPARTVSFTVTGGDNAQLVTGFTMVDARGRRPDPDIGPVADGAVLDVSAHGGVLGIRADSARVGSVVLALAGPRELRRTEDARPYALFGESAGDFSPGWLPNGAYVLTATPYTASGGGGTARPARTVSFTVAGADAVQSVTGFTVVDARGGAPDRDVGPLEDGATLDVSAYGGAVNIRANGAGGSYIGSMVFELAGATALTRSEDGGEPYTLFGAKGGDYHEGWLPNGAYLLTATPYTGRGGRGAALPARTVSFTVAGTDAPSPVTGFTLVDARGGAPDPDVGPVADGAVLDVSPYGGDVSIRAESVDGMQLGSVVLELSGARALTRTEDAGSPYTLFGDHSSGNYYSGWLPNGAYTLTATPYTERGGRGAALAARSVSFTVAGGHAASVVTGFTLVDARGGAPDPDVGPVEDGAVLDVSAYGGDVNIRAQVSGAFAGSVVFELAGTRALTRTENGSPFTLFGDGRGDYGSGWLPDGAYTLTATSFAENDGGGAMLAAQTVSFTVTGGDAAQPLTGFTVVDARGGAPDPDVGPIGEGAVVDVSAYGGEVSIRADGADGPYVGSVMFELSGARALTRTEDIGGPYTLFGDHSSGDYVSGWLPDGAYTLTATPYTERRARGAALPARTVSFTVAGGHASSVVTGFTLVDARGGAPDPDVGPVEDGAVLDVSAYGGEVNIRADGADGGHVGSVVFELAGPRELVRTEDAGGPYTLFGDSSGNYYAGWLPNGAYTLTVTPYTERRGHGAAMSARMVSFTVRGTSPDAVRGFTLVNASGGAPDPDIGAIVAGSTVDLAPAVAVNVRAEVDAVWPVGSVRLTLVGAAYASRVANTRPFTLFGKSGADHAGRVLPSGRYMLTAQPYAGADGTGEALTPTAVRFALDVDAARSPLTGVVLVDPTGGAPDPDLGPLADGATVDVGATGGAIAVRAETASELGSVVFALDGLSGWRRVENGAPFALFGEDGGDYRPGWLVDGAYTLTATPYSANGAGTALPAVEVSFTVTGADAADSPVTGFTVVDAAGPGPHLDLAEVADGGTLNLAGAGRAVNIRAEVSAGAGLASVRFDLRGAQVATDVDAAVAYALFGGGMDGVYEAGSLRNGAYSLTATPYEDAAGTERMAGRPRAVSFTVTGSTAGPLEANIAAADGTVGEGTAAAFTVTVARPAPAAGLSVSVSVSATGEVLSGTAPAFVAFAGGAASATLAVATADDRVVRGDGAVTATLVAGEGYVLGAASSARVTVEDDDAATWAASFAPAEAAEGGTAELAVSITNGTTFAADQTLVLTASGTASAADHDLSSSLTLAAGGSAARATVTVADDEDAEGAETLTVAVAHDGAAVASATLAVLASDPPAATVAAVSASVLEGAPAVFEVALDRAAPAGGLAVSVSATDPDGRLDGPSPAAVAFAAGETSARLELGTADDAVAAAAGTVTATLHGGDGYVLGATASATVAVEENDAASWTVSVVPAAVEEGGRATVSVSIANGVVHADDRTVSLSVSGLEASEYVLSASEVVLSASAVVLAAGASAVTATLEVLEDGTAEAARTATVTATVDGVEVAAGTLTVADAGAAPEVAGLAQVGEVLEAVVDGLSAEEAAVYGWLRDGEAVPGATGSTHALTAVDVGTRLSVQVERLGRTRSSAATTPVWAAPWNAPLGADEEELLGAELTLGHARTLATTLAGYARLPTREFGVLSPSSLRLGSAHEVDALFVRIRGDGGIVALATTPELPSSEEGLTVHWNGHLAGPLSATALSDGLRGWTARTAQPKTELSWLMDASAAGLRVAVSVRRPLPVASLSAAETSVAEGAAALFEVALDRPAAADVEVAVAVTASDGVLDGTPPSAVGVAAGSTAGTLAVPTAADRVVRGGGAATATLLDGAGYRLAGTLSATVAIADDDTAAWAVSLAPAEIAEGGSATLTVSVTNGVTFARDLEIALAASGTAAAWEIALPGTVRLAAGADAAAATLEALQDGEAPEAAEVVTVTATLDGAVLGTATVTIAAHERSPSTDATLASLTLSAAEIAFAPETTSYAAAVAHAVESTTVSAEPRDAAASVEIADASGSTAGRSRTVALAEGPNAVRVTLTAEDAATTRTYTVEIVRAPAASWGTRLPERDVALQRGAAPSGLWSDGATLWVADWWVPTLTAYALADGARLAARDLRLADVRMAAGLHASGGVLRVADHLGGVFGYALADGTRLAPADLSEAALVAAGIFAPTGLWSDGATLWVAALPGDRLYAHRVSDGARLADADVVLEQSGGVPDPWGVWSDGRTLLAAAHNAGAVRVYGLADGRLQRQRTIATAASGQRGPTGLWSDGETLWVADGGAGTVLAYALPGLAEALSSGAGDPFAVGARSWASAVPSGTAAGPAVRIADAALRGRIAAALGRRADDTLGAHGLASLTALDARGAGIASLDGLGAAVNLEALDLGLNPVADLRALASLPRLRTLNLDGTAADLWQLAGLAELERLSLRNAGLTDASALSGLAGLRVLDVAHNRIEDLSPLGGLSRLEALRLDGVPVADLSPLAGLALLRHVSLRGVAADPAPLADLGPGILIVDAAPEGRTR